jgi:hypothetical protein
MLALKRLEPLIGYRSSRKGYSTIVSAIFIFSFLTLWCLKRYIYSCLPELNLENLIVYASHSEPLKFHLIPIRDWCDYRLHMRVSASETLQVNV